MDEKNLIGFSGSADVEGGQGKLEADNSIRLSVPAPYNPHYVAEQGKEKSPVTPAFGLIGQQPDRRYVDNHRGPLQKTKVIHKESDSPENRLWVSGKLNAMSDFTGWSRWSTGRANRYHRIRSPRIPCAKTQMSAQSHIQPCSLGAICNRIMGPYGFRC